MRLNHETLNTDLIFSEQSLELAARATYNSSRIAVRLHTCSMAPVHGMYKKNRVDRSKAYANPCALHKRCLEIAGCRFAIIHVEMAGK